MKRLEEELTVVNQRKFSAIEKSLESSLELIEYIKAEALALEHPLRLF